MTETSSPALPSSSRLIITLAIVAMLSGLLVVIVYEVTKPVIAENQRRATERALFKVLPQIKTSLAWSVDHERLVPATDTNFEGTIYSGYDGDGRLLGLAIPAAGQGYQDVIRILYGYNPFTGCITGFDVLKSTETPGFGTKISTDEQFLANFDCLAATVKLDGSALSQTIRTVRHGSKQHAWEIDAISGSTITSNAMGKMLNRSAQAFHPVIAANLKLLQHPDQ